MKPDEIEKKDLQIIVAAIREIWSDLRSYRSNMWQIVGFFLVSVTLFMNLFAVTLQDAPSTMAVVASLFVSFALMCAFFGFQYALWILSQNTNERILTLRQIEDEHSGQYIRSVEGNVIHRVGGVEIIRRVSWFPIYDIWTVFVWLWGVSVLISLAFSVATLAMSYGYIAPIIMGMLPILMIFILVGKLSSQWASRITLDENK